MKYFIAILVVWGSISFTSDAYARDGLWISNKLTVGYNQIYIASQIDILRQEPVRVRIEHGYIFDPHDNIELVPRYILQIPTPGRRLEHIIGIDLKLRFP